MMRSSTSTPPAPDSTRWTRSRCRSVSCTVAARLEHLHQLTKHAARCATRSLWGFAVVEPPLGLAQMIFEGLGNCFPGSVR